MTAAPEFDAIDAGWPHDAAFLDELCAVQPVEPANDAPPPEPTSGVRARPVPVKPPLPIRVVVERYLRARLEAESRMESGERVTVEIGDEVHEVVMVADSIGADGRITRRGGLRVESRRASR